MKHRIILCMMACCCCGGAAQHALSQSQALEQKPVVLEKGSIPSGDTRLDVLLQYADKVYGVTFCCEAFHAKEEIAFPRKQIATSDFIGKSLEQFLSFLKAQDIEVVQHGTAILLRSDAFSKRISDPLNTTINNFTFKGNLTKFIAALGDCFPELPPELSVDNPSSEEFTYQFEIQHRVSIRDVLLGLTERYGTSWTLIIGERKPAQKPHGPTNAVLQQSEYEMTWFFDRWN